MLVSPSQGMECWVNQERIWLTEKSEAMLFILIFKKKGCDVGCHHLSSWELTKHKTVVTSDCFDVYFQKLPDSFRQMMARWTGHMVEYHIILDGYM